MVLGFLTRAGREVRYFHTPTMSVHRFAVPREVLSRLDPIGR